MDPNSERKVSVENALAEFESLRNKLRMLKEMHTKISSTFIEGTVFSDNESESKSKCHSPDSGFSNEKLAHLLVIENETNDSDKVTEVPVIELDNTESSKESTNKFSKKQKAKKEKQLHNQIAAPVENEDIDETETAKENQNPTNVDRKYAIVHSKFNDFKFIKPHTHPTIPQPNTKSKSGKRNRPRVPPATKRSKPATNTTTRVSQKSESAK